MAENEEDEKEEPSSNGQGSPKEEANASQRRTNNPAGMAVRAHQVANIEFETEGVISTAREPKSSLRAKGGDTSDLRVPTDTSDLRVPTDAKTSSQAVVPKRASRTGDNLRKGKGHNTRKGFATTGAADALGEGSSQTVAPKRASSQVVVPKRASRTGDDLRDHNARKEPVTTDVADALDEGSSQTVENETRFEERPPKGTDVPSKEAGISDIFGNEEGTPSPGVRNKGGAPSSKDLQVGKDGKAVTSSTLKVKRGMSFAQRAKGGSLSMRADGKGTSLQKVAHGDERKPKPAITPNGTKTIAGVTSAVAGAVSAAVATVAATVTTIVASLGPVLISLIVTVVVVVSVLMTVFSSLVASLSSTETTTNYYLDGLPSWVTYELVLTALEMQEEYGHPAGCTLAQMIYESGPEKSNLASTYHNLFGITYASTNDYVTGSVVLSGSDKTWAVFDSDVSCIEYRSYMISVSSYYANDLVAQAIAECDSDLMAQGLEEGGWSGSGYAESLISVMKYYDLYKFDGLTVEEFESSYTGGLLPDEYEDLTDAQRAVVDACYTTPFTGLGYCALWVQNVYKNSGLYDGISLFNQTGYCSQLNASTYHQNNGITGNACCLYWGWADYNVYDNGLGALEAGMFIASVDYYCVTSSKIGHVGIYIGTIDGIGYVMHNSDSIKITPLDEWIEAYSYGSTYVGYGWIADVDLSQE